jgi:hypothetical protein
MRAAFALIAAAALLGAALPSRACTPPPGWPTKARIDLSATARVLVTEAATVDLVVAESASDDFEVGTSPSATALALANVNADGGHHTAQQVVTDLRAEWADDGVRFHYRIVEHLKGDGAETFTLNGANLPPPPIGPGVVKPAKPRQSDLLRFRLGSRDLADWEGFGACITPLWTKLGGRYLVFRDADGRLLNRAVPVAFERNVVEVQGPVYAEVFGSDDTWLAAVRKALTPAR